jgi:hypothetical protein
MGLSADSIGTLQQLALTYPIPVFYSTNAWMKYYINENYHGGRHFIWCSEAFDGQRRHVRGSPPPPRSSSPMEIYRELLSDVQSRDYHSAKITQQKHSLNSLAQKWLAEGGIGQIEFDEIATLVNAHDFNNWRPLIYVIPQRAIDPARVQVVRPGSRAGAVGREYIIADLMASEFDVLEPTRC